MFRFGGDRARPTRATAPHPGMDSRSARLDSACVPKLPQAAFEIGEANEISKETAIAAAPAALDTRYRVLFDQDSCAGISS